LDTIGLVRDGEGMSTSSSLLNEGLMLAVNSSTHTNLPTSTPSLKPAGSTLRLPGEENPRSFWWAQKPGSTLTTSSGASKDSGFSLGRGWAWGLAKVFGRKGGRKGPVLSVSKEGYFQRTNLRRSSGRRPKYPIRSSVLRRSGGNYNNRKRVGSVSRKAPLISPQNETLYSQYSLDENYQDYNSSLSKEITESCLDDEAVIFVPPQRRKPKNVIRPKRNPNSSLYYPHPEQSRVEYHRFDTIEIRLPRLKCEINNASNVLITKAPPSSFTSQPHDGGNQSDECNHNNVPIDSVVMGFGAPKNSKGRIWTETASDTKGNFMLNKCQSKSVENLLAGKLMSSNSHNDIAQEQNEETSSVIPISKGLIKRKESGTRRNRPVKLLVKHTSIYRRNSTLKRKQKNGPTFALPRPMIKIGKKMKPCEGFKLIM
jgi:hypothetical protein